ncbi:MAG: menaquinone biosynthesis protein [Ignavibacteria bacterium]|nr:menaquinone biosynthesis protein [Ignavibacteria bacterium]
MGKIPYLNSIPFYANFEKRQFKMLPVAPRRMGMLSERGGIDAGPFSLVDYLRQEDKLELMGWCIATRDQVKSVMLFSKEGWADLQGKKIGITDETTTSVKLLQVLLEKKYGVQAQFERLHSGINDYSRFDAVLLIGDEALRRNKYGLDGFELVYDLAREWYEWQKLPFVFAVWACKRSLAYTTKTELNDLLSRSLSASEEDFLAGALLSGARIGLTEKETQEYLAGFNYRLGERETEAMGAFGQLISEVEGMTSSKEAIWGE